MAYYVKEIYYTIQGEGALTGRPAVFCRFAGCNLWTGREEDRGSAVCKFCDTEFVGTNGPGGGEFRSADELAEAVVAEWPGGERLTVRPFVVCTGGEPLLQMDQDLVDAMHNRGLEIAIETNGTRLPPGGIDWICVSPKAGAELVLKSGDELKLVYPQPGAEPELYEHLEFEHFSLQPMDGPEREANTKLTVEYCLKNPRWRLSLQVHKYLEVP
ncbi:MAG: 7-carboxy-7-deazaguanine synthase [Bacteroidota bacterium]